MNKGFSLIETILYVSLLSLLIIGVFSSILSFVYSNENKKAFSDENYSDLIKDFHEN